MFHILANVNTNIDSTMEVLVQSAKEKGVELKLNKFMVSQKVRVYEWNRGQVWY